MSHFTRVIARGINTNSTNLLTINKALEVYILWSSNCILSYIQMDEDSTLNELHNRISALKEQRSQLMNATIAERREVELMQGEMLKMKKQKSYLEGLIRQKTTASKEYDRIISESQRTLSKLSDNTKKLLLSVDNQYGKYLHK